MGSANLYHTLELIADYFAFFLVLFPEFYWILTKTFILVICVRRIFEWVCLKLEV